VTRSSSRLAAGAIRETCESELTRVVKSYTVIYMNTNPLPLGTIVTVEGVTGTVAGIGTVHRDGAAVPQWLIRTPTTMVRVTGNEVYRVEVV